MTTTDLAGLIAKLEGASEGDVTLDVAIVETLFDVKVDGTVVWETVEAEERDEDGGVYVALHDVPRPILHYTRSLDAALTLVPEGAPLIIGKAQTTETRPWARVGQPAHGADTTAATLPLALSAAALKARSQS